MEGHNVGHCKLKQLLKTYPPLSTTYFVIQRLMSHRQLKPLFLSSTQKLKTTGGLNCWNYSLLNSRMSHGDVSLTSKKYWEKQIWKNQFFMPYGTGPHLAHFLRDVCTSFAWDPPRAWWYLLQEGMVIFVSNYIEARDRIIGPPQRQYDKSLPDLRSKVVLPAAPRILLMKRGECGSTIDSLRCRFKSLKPDYRVSEISRHKKRSELILYSLCTWCLMRNRKPPSSWRLRSRFRWQKVGMIIASCLWPSSSRPLPGLSLAQSRQGSRLKPTH
jgi:hypothetical protein